MIEKASPLAAALPRIQSRLQELLPEHWDDANWLKALFSGLLEAFLVAFCWWYARRRLPGALPTLLRLRLERSGEYVVPDDFWGLAPSLRRAGAAAVDLAVCAILLPPLRGSFPELGLLVLVYAQIALYRLATSLVALAIAEHPQVRPALRTLRPSTRALALGTVRALFAWGILYRFLTYIVHYLWILPDVEDRLRSFFHVVLVVLLLGLLHLWERPLREMLLRHYPDNLWLDRLCRPSLGIVRALRVPFLIPLGCVSAVHERIKNRGGWIAGWLHERDAEQPTGVPSELPAEVVKAILMRECSDAEYLERDAARGKFEQEWQRWERERRRGVLTVVGDEGMGKQAFVDRRAAEMKAAGREVLRLRLHERLTSAEEMARLLGETFGVGNPPTDPVALGARLGETLAGKVVVLESLHLAFLRRVDGFNAMRALLRVLGTASAQTFWVLAMHRPAWRYLTSTGLLDTGLCEPVLELGGFSQDELARLVMSRTTASGATVSFSPLAPRRPPGRMSYTLERAEKEYFRRLTWVSQGNPSVALRLWRETLQVDPLRPDRLEVQRFCYLRHLPELRDADLFVLVAIRTHRALSLGELVEVTNLGPGVVQAALSKLEGLRLVTPRARNYAIEPLYLPAVTADLRRRHILYDEARPS